MTSKFAQIKSIFLAFGLMLSFFSVLDAQNRTTKHMAKGTFEVKMTPLPVEDGIGDPTIGRLAMDKTWSGDLAGTSKGQMLGSQSETEKGSGGYVAMERFTGTLDGKKGSFSLQHHGTMDGGKFDINVSVIPGSGTGDLAGISGTLKIIIEGSKSLRI